MITCRKCGVEKDELAFGKDKHHRKTGRQTMCRECVKEWQEDHADHLKAYRHQRYLKNRDRILAMTSAYRKANKEKLKPYCAASHQKRVHGLTRDAYTAILEKQEGTCPICGVDLLADGAPKRNTDHNHITGAIRGVLCFQCNLGLGHFKDQAALLRSAADYLDEHNGHA